MLSQAVGHVSVCAAGGHRIPEPFPLVCSRKPFDLDDFAMLSFVFDNFAAHVLPMIALGFTVIRQNANAKIDRPISIHLRINIRALTSPI